jgi:formylmethanofuran dehydrogenase subunit E
MRAGGEEMLDNYDRWLSHEAELEAELEARPKCAECGEHIQDEHCYEIAGEVICEHCLNEHYRRWTDEIV